VPQVARGGALRGEEAMAAFLCSAGIPPAFLDLGPRQRLSRSQGIVGTVRGCLWRVRGRPSCGGSSTCRAPTGKLQTLHQESRQDAGATREAKVKGAGETPAVREANTAALAARMAVLAAHRAAVALLAPRLARALLAAAALGAALC
jgi:hypothetical protein